MTARSLLAAAALAGLAVPSSAAEIVSEYTEIELERGCAQTAVDAESAFVSFVCPGWRGFPILIDAGDERESVFYGFPSGADDNVWESFSAFNAAVGRKIEWRVTRDGDTAVPFAAIQRWSVNADPDDASKKVEVLVVERVGQPGIGGGCAVGLVLATGNAKANETARRIADEQARDFSCGADERVLVGGDQPLPAFDRTQ